MVVSTIYLVFNFCILKLDSELIDLYCNFCCLLTQTFSFQNGLPTLSLKKMFLCRAICSGLLVEMTNKVFPWNRVYCQMGVCAFCSLRDIPVIAQGGKVNADGNLFEAALLMQTWVYSVWLLLKRVGCFCLFLFFVCSSSLSAKHRSTLAACHHNDDSINVVNKRLGGQKIAWLKLLGIDWTISENPVPGYIQFINLLLFGCKKYFLVFRK